jgi:hypothetical protein
MNDLGRASAMSPTKFSSSRNYDSQTSMKANSIVNSDSGRSSADSIDNSVNSKNATSINLPKMKKRNGKQIWSLNSFSQMQDQVNIRSEPVLVKIRWREQSFTIKTLKFGFCLSQIIDSCFANIDLQNLEPEISKFFIGKRYANSPEILIWFSHEVDVKRYNLNKGVFSC